MPVKHTPERPPTTAWLAQTLRLTAFPSPTAEIAATTWWIDLVGEPPETRVSHPRQGERRDEGPCDEGKLSLRVQPTRIDWLFTPVDDQEQRLEGIPNIGPFLDSLDTFFPLMLRWFEFETCPSVQRLAFGSVLLQPVENRETGYRRLSTYLPAVELDPEESSDFIYQINRPRTSRLGTSDLKINRLSKWSVATMRGVGLLVGSASVVDYDLGEALFACRLELDINTAQDFRGEISPDQQAIVFQELVDLGKEIANEGDIS